MSREKPVAPFIAVVMALAAATIAISILLMPRARAHDAPLGWSYPFACCSNMDCRQVAAADIVEGAQGYLIRATGELIPMTSPKVRDSPDGAFHWCSVGGADDGKTICLFVPPRSF